MRVQSRFIQWLEIQCFCVGFFIDPGPLSPDPSLAGKENFSKHSFTAVKVHVPLPLDNGFD